MSFNDEVDGWVSQLMGCKPLSEAEVKKLCDKVSF
jgi:serine/threonine-protein phosphatase 2A catalytic subunit